MYWSQLSGSFDNNSLPKGVSYESINGDYKKLSFKNFKLEKNSSIEFEFLMNSILERIIFGPIGVFIRDDSNNISYDVNTKINWKEAEGIEKLDLPNSITRYEQNNPTKHLHGNMIGHIVPTPKTIKKLDGKFEIKDTLTLWLSNETYFDEYKETIWMYFNNAENYLKIKHDLKEPIGGGDIKITQLYKDTYEVSDEGYRMNILDDLVHIYVKDKIGLSHALTSLFQLFMNAKNEGSNYISNFQIHDFPRFRYRGIHLDISRNFHGPEKIKQLLDYMHYFKLNKFHLNITDDEGWRIEIPDLPELTDVGSKRGYTIDERDHLNPAYGSGSSVDRLHGSGYIKRDEFIEIIKYANDRNIELIPEINFPAHSRAAVKAMESRYFNYLEKVIFYLKKLINFKKPLKLHKDVMKGYKTQWSAFCTYTDDNKCLAPDYAYNVVDKKDNYPVRLGSKSLRFELRSGDCHQKRPGSYNDCKATPPAERHEFFVSI